MNDIVSVYVIFARIFDYVSKGTEKITPKILNLLKNRPNDFHVQIVNILKTGYSLEPLILVRNLEKYPNILFTFDNHDFIFSFNGNRFRLNIINVSVSLDMKVDNGSIEFFYNPDKYKDIEFLKKTIKLFHDVLKPIENEVYTTISKDNLFDEMNIRKAQIFITEKFLGIVSFVELENSFKAVTDKIV